MYRNESSIRKRVIENVVDMKEWKLPVYKAELL